MSQQFFYKSGEWRKLRSRAKKRDRYQCQVCGDRKGDPYCELHAHHIITRATGGTDTMDNLITLCDLCHAVVTPRWRRPWFGDLTTAQHQELDDIRKEYQEFLSLEPQARVHRQVGIWHDLGINHKTT